MSEQNVTLSQEDMDKINSEIEKVEQSKLEESKKEGYTKGVIDGETKSEIEKLKAEISKTNETYKKEVEALKAQLEKSKEIVEEQKPRTNVQPSPNPYKPQEVITVKPVEKSREEQWGEFERAVTQGGFKASVKK